MSCRSEILPGPSRSDQIWNHPVTRWIAVIPGAIVASIVASIVATIIEWVLGAGGGGTWFGMEVTSVDPNGEISKGLGYNLMTYVIHPGAIAGAFVYAGRVIAPTYKWGIGWVFAGITCLLAVWLYTGLYSATDGQLGLGNWMFVLSFAVGGFVGAGARLDDVKNDFSQIINSAGNERLRKSERVGDRGATSPHKTQTEREISATVDDYAIQIALCDDETKRQRQIKRVAKQYAKSSAYRAELEAYLMKSVAALRLSETPPPLSVLRTAGEIGAGGYAGVS